ncbi:cytochrome c [Flavobacterium pedocola]
MKVKVLGLAIASVLIYSCASKQVVETTKKEEPVKQEAVKQEVVVQQEIAKEEIKAAVMLTENQLHGKTVYENNCAKCHKLFEPTSHSATEWKPVLERMQKKAKISDEDTASVYNYLTAQM